MFAVGEAPALVCCLERSPGLGKMLTCRDEEDACAEDDAVPAAVELAGGHTEPPEEQQCDTEDGEDAGGPHSPCGGKERRFRLCSSQTFAVVVGCLQTGPCRTGEKSTHPMGV